MPSQASSVSKVCGCSPAPGRLITRTPAAIVTTASSSNVRRDRPPRQAGSWPIVEQRCQHPHRIPVHGRAQEYLVCDPLLIKGQDVADRGPQFEQGDPVVVLARVVSSGSARTSSASIASRKLAKVPTR